MKLLNTSILALFATFSAHAFSASGWSGWKHIKSIQVNPTNSEVLMDSTVTAGCVNVDGGAWFQILDTDPQKSFKHSVILTAFAAGKLINVYCDAAAYPTVTTIKVSN